MTDLHNFGMFVVDGVSEVVDTEDSRSIQSRFLEFHGFNPWVYEHLVGLARQLRQRGHERLGIGMLWEVLRWHVFMGTFDPSSEFKLNDHYRSRYARLIMDQEVDLRGAFEIRELKA